MHTPLDRHSVPLPAVATDADVAALLSGLLPVGRLPQRPRCRALLSYARTSKSIQTTIEAQHERIYAMAKRAGIPVTQKRQDEGRSGMRNDREEYRLALEELASGEYSHLGLYKADRLARDSVELISTVRVCWGLGITVLDTTVGEITPQNLHLLAMLAENEIRQLSERTMIGLEDKARDRKLGSGRLGYKHLLAPRLIEGREVLMPVPGQWVPDEEGAAPVIRELGQRFAAGEGLLVLTRWFNARMGTTHAPDHIRSLLGCEYYAGWVVNRKTTRSILEGGRRARPQEEWSRPFRHAYPLWDEETWGRIQARLRTARNVGQHRRKQSSYALQGLIWCARCQRRMTGHDRGSKGTNYRCVVCSYERGLRKVERAVRVALEKLHLCSLEAATDLAERLAQERTELERQLGELSAARKSLHAKRMRAYDRWDEGAIDQQQYNDQITRIDAQTAALAAQERALTSQIAALPQTAQLVGDVAARREEWLRWPQEIPTLPIEEQQGVYRECCKRITLDPQENTLTVEYTDHIALLVGAARHSVALS